jgi:hypothetical protein
MVAPRVEPIIAAERYPRRNRNPPTYLKDYVKCLDKEDQILSSVDYCYRVSAFPQSYNDAIKSDEATHWEEAMREEMKSLKENETFTLTELPQGREPVGGRWVYTIKEGGTGGKTYKARYVAKGYSQVEGIDYYETFAPTANLLSIRVLMQLAVQHNLILHQMDVKTAYLNAPLDCEIYMEQAEGFHVNSTSDRKLVYKLNKALYGLKQSGRMWNKMLDDFLTENGFVRNTVDHCIYVKEYNGEVCVVLVWVDDMLIASSSEKLLSEVKQKLGDRFKMKDLGKLSYFLGIDFEQGEGFVKMNQKKYICKILERFEMSNCKPKYTVSEAKLEFSSAEASDPRYRELVGSLIYAMTCTRPDICWVVTKLSQYLAKPCKDHWIAAKHVLRYLKGTLDYELCFERCGDGLALIGYSDADWASSTEDRRSTTGYYFSLSEKGPPISWKSRRQPTVALSSCEAEYIALAAAVQESLYLKQLLKGFGSECQTTPVVIYEDNQGTIALSKNPVKQQRSNVHLDVCFHFIRTEVNRGNVVVKYCPTEDMVADIMTKPATRVKLEKFKTALFGM